MSFLVVEMKSKCSILWSLPDYNPVLWKYYSGGPVVMPDFPG